MLKPYGDKIVIFSIIKARGADGATIGEIHHDYKEITGKDSQFFSKPVEQIIGFLDSLPGLRMHTLTSGAYVWCVKDDFLDKIEDLSPDTLVQIDSSFTWTTDESDTVTSTSWRPHSDSDLEMQADVDTDADIAFLDDLNAEEHTADVPILHGFELIGDNYFLSLATNELGFYKDPENPNSCGKCISGQTLQSFTRNVEKNFYTFATPCVLINLGTMDIVSGRDLTNIQSDMLRLVNALIQRSILPIVTTLANIKITSCGGQEQSEIYRKTLLFNNFIIEMLPQDSYAIDFWQQMVDRKRKTLDCYYQPQPTYITVNKHNVGITLWNKLGRQHFLRCFQQNIC